MSLTTEQFEAVKAELSQPNHRTITSIAASLGVGKGVVIGRLFRAGIRTRPSLNEIHDAIDAQRPRIIELAEMGACAWAIAREIGCAHITLSRYCQRHGIEIRVHQPSTRNSGARAALGAAFGKRRPLAPRDRAEMDRLRDEAIAAGKVTKCPPAYAYGALKWGRSEYAS